MSQRTHNQWLEHRAYLIYCVQGHSAEGQWDM